MPSNLIFKYSHVEQINWNSNKILLNNVLTGGIKLQHLWLRCELMNRVVTPYSTEWWIWIGHRFSKIVELYVLLVFIHISYLCNCIRYVIFQWTHVPNWICNFSIWASKMKYIIHRISSQYWENCSWEIKLILQVIWIVI